MARSSGGTSSIGPLLGAWRRTRALCAAWPSHAQAITSSARRTTRPSSCGQRVRRPRTRHPWQPFSAGMPSPTWTTTRRSTRLRPAGQYCSCGTSRSSQFSRSRGVDSITRVRFNCAAQPLGALSNDRSVTRTTCNRLAHAEGSHADAAPTLYWNPWSPPLHACIRGPLVVHVRHAQARPRHLRAFGPRVRRARGRLLADRQAVCVGSTTPGAHLAVGDRKSDTVYHTKRMRRPTARRGRWTPTSSAAPTTPTCASGARGQRRSARAGDEDEA